ncbi:MAG: hypothetical protein P8J18_03615 [Halieaceae bacterium]|nr:hypothetical protein [Halieaceae bacterium]
MKMKVVKKTETYTIFHRNDNRYAVKDLAKNYINGIEKTRILIEEGLINAALREEKVEVSSDAEQTEEEQIVNSDGVVSDDSSADEEQSEVAVEEPDPKADDKGLEESTD